MARADRPKACKATRHGLHPTTRGAAAGLADAEIAMLAEEAMPHPRRDTDAAYPTSQFHACSQLIAEALHYLKVAAGQASDIHYARRLEEAEQRRARAQQGADASAGSRPGDPDPWARYGANARRRACSNPARGPAQQRPKTTGSSNSQWQWR